MNSAKFDRSTQDVGNILSLEHVNFTVPDQGLATFFYVNGLGFTRDPYVDFGPFNVWINVGDEQFHLPNSKPQVLRGHVGVVVPDLNGLQTRLRQIEGRLSDTLFKWRARKQYVDVTCPWGNHIRCYGPGSFGDLKLGMPYVEFKVNPKTARGISLFYNEAFGAPATVNKDSSGTYCEVSVGKRQSLIFRETKKALPVYDGHHIAIYLVNFSAPYKFLKKKRLITEETDATQYRFQKIVHPKTGETLFEVEHEVRSLHHPMHERHLVNRNPAQSFFGYQRGRDAFVP
jgi:hypothetical protein|tara:strand:+ start:3144 stop:4004 length:861 start_codon:yes stop_codon:yes gene_type:complete